MQKVLGLFGYTVAVAEANNIVGQDDDTATVIYLGDDEASYNDNDTPNQSEFDLLDDFGDFDSTAAATIPVSSIVQNQSTKEAENNLPHDFANTLDKIANVELVLTTTLANTALVEQTASLVLETAAKRQAEQDNEAAAGLLDLAAMTASNAAQMTWGFAKKAALATGITTISAELAESLKAAKDEFTQIFDDNGAPGPEQNPAPKSNFLNLLFA